MQFLCTQSPFHVYSYLGVDLERTLNIVVVFWTNVL